MSICSSQLPSTSGAQYGCVPTVDKASDALGSKTPDYHISRLEDRVGKPPPMKFHELSTRRRAQNSNKKAVKNSDQEGTELSSRLKRWAVNFMTDKALDSPKSVILT